MLGDGSRESGIVSGSAPFAEQFRARAPGPPNLRYSSESSACRCKANNGQNVCIWYHPPNGRRSVADWRCTNLLRAELCPENSKSEVADFDHRFIIMTCFLMNCFWTNIVIHNRIHMFSARLNLITFFLDFQTGIKRILNSMLKNGLSSLILFFKHFQGEKTCSGKP